MFDSWKIDSQGAAGLSRNRYVLGALAALAVLTFGLVAMTNAPQAHAQGGGQDVCNDLGDWDISPVGNWVLPPGGDPNGSVKIDVPDQNAPNGGFPVGGDANVTYNADGSVTITAPAGWLVHDYCVKGGQEIDGFPDAIILDSAVKTITLGPLVRPDQPNAAVSHFSLSFIEDENGEDEEGCTPGYWKNHTGLPPQLVNSWLATGYTTSQTVGSVFTGATPYSGNTLLEALGFPGGTGVDGAKRILLRAGVAALLNAAHPDIDYDGNTYDTSAEVIAAVNAALAQSRNKMIALAETLDDYNNQGCPFDVDDAEF